MSGDGASSVISHAAAESCIQVPMLEATSAIQRPRNRGRRRGLQAEGAVISRIYDLRVGSGVDRDRLLQAAHIPPAVVALAVDENRRCSFDAVRDPALHVSFDPLGELVCRYGLPKGAHVGTRGLGVALETG